MSAITECTDKGGRRVRKCAFHCNHHHGSCFSLCSSCSFYDVIFVGCESHVSVCRCNGCNSWYIDIHKDDIGDAIRHAIGGYRNTVRSQHDRGRGWTFDMVGTRKCSYSCTNNVFMDIIVAAIAFVVVVPF